MIILIKEGFESTVANMSFPHRCSQALILILIPTPRTGISPDTTIPLPGLY